MANDSFRNVNKENVWSNNYIDNFKKMIDNHHKSLNSFQRVGTMLEMSSRIYGLKVDSLHNDVLGLSSGIRRQSIVQPISESDATTTDISCHSIRRRRSCTKIAGNKETINSPLQTVEQPCHLWNSINNRSDFSSRNLLLNVLASDKYALSLQSKRQLWFSDQDTEDALNEEDNETAILNSVSVDFPLLNWMPTSNSDVIRPRLGGYTISNSPCQNFWFPKTTTAVDQMEMQDDEMMFDGAAIDFRFDIDADVVPTMTDSVLLVPTEISNSFTEDDQNALLRCSVLQRSGVAADDMRPVSCSPLVYSYRQLTEEPLPTDANHWKLPSIGQNTSKGKRKTTGRRRKSTIKSKPVVCRMSLNETVDRKFVSIDDPHPGVIKMSNQTKWNPNKLKLASRMCSTTALSFLPLIIDCLENDNCHEEPEEPNVEIYVAANEIDPAVVMASNSFLDQTNEVILDVVDELSVVVNEFNGVDEVADLSVHDVVVSPMCVPQQLPFQPVESVQLISPSNVNAKAISKRCLEIICEVEAAGGIVTFAQIYHRLQTNNLVITPSLTFSSILELANQNNFNLRKISENDFVIERM